MNKREKVIQALKACGGTNYLACQECPYSVDGNDRCVEHLTEDTISLIESQKTIICQVEITPGDLAEAFYECTYEGKTVREWIELIKKARQDY